MNASTDSVASWLPVAARRLSGDLRFVNIASGRNDATTRNEAGPFDLPCFESASSIKLDLGLGWLGLALPPSGVFSCLTNLYLRHVQLYGPCRLGDVVSSPRCPVLRRLAVRDAWGLGNLTIHSKSVLQMELNSLYDLQQLTVVAPSLEELTVSSCFDNVCRSSQPVVNISAPQLVMLRWSDAFNPSSVELGNVAHLESLDTSYFLVYGPDEVASNASCLMMLSQFKAIHHLNLNLAYMPDIFSNDRYLIEDMTRLPGVTFLSLLMMANGHSFGATLFHVLRMCTGVRKLALEYLEPFQPQTVCPSGCICEQLPNWKTEELVLGGLQEVEIVELTGTEHEAAFVQQLFRWATVVKKMTVSFHHSVTRSKAKDLCQMLLSFSRPEICMEFYVYRCLSEKVLYVPED